jgi:hypothetical protein
MASEHYFAVLLWSEITKKISISIERRRPIGFLFQDWCVRVDN